MSLLSPIKHLFINHPQVLHAAVAVHNGAAGLFSWKIKGKSNRVLGCSFLRHSRITILGNDNTIDLGRLNYYNHCEFTIIGNSNQISIGENAALTDAELWIEDNGNRIAIGDHTAICGATHLAATEGRQILIGSDCLFSADVVIRTGDSHSVIDCQSQKRINPAKDVCIGNHVWIGNKTILLKGSRIPDNSIVGSGAVITKEFLESNTVLAGNPARIVKKNIDWRRDRI